MQKVWVPIFKVKVTVWIQILKELFISWILVHHHELECCVTILACCPQGQGHSEGSNPQGIFNETWYVGVSSWSGVSYEKFGFLSSRSRYSLKISTLTVTLMTTIKNCHKTLWLMMMHYYAMFGCTRFRSTGDMEEIINYFLFAKQTLRKNTQPSLSLCVCPSQVIPGNY